MAEDRNNSQGFLGQAHTTEHGSPPPPAPTATSSTTTGVTSTGVGAIGGTIVRTRGSGRDDSPPRGPRTLLLRRSENGFGFTLRHFIVYPPESCCMLPGHERTGIELPMDTIFVKQVRGNSPAAEAGLRTGDRVVSVDGKPTRGEEYAKVVQRIQQAGPWLRLLVVSKEDDILQKYFGETAHNPETNQRPRLRSPDRSSQRQRRSVSLIPGLSPRTRQSWVCSGSSSMPVTGSQPDSLEDTLLRDEEFSKENRQPIRSGANKAQSQMQSLFSSSSSSSSPPPPPPPSMTTATTTTATSLKTMMHRCKPFQEITSRYESIDDKVRLRNQQQSAKDSLSSGSVQSSIQPDSRADRYDVYDRTRPESIYSRTNSEQIYDRIKDPIYERVRSGEPGPTSMEEHQRQQYYQSLQQQPSLTRYPLSRAEPQVPIYRPAMRRITSRRASEGSTGSSTINNFETANYSSTDALRSCDPGSRFSIDSRRDNSPARDDLPSYDSSSLGFGHETSENRNEPRHAGSNGTRNGNASGNGDERPSIEDSVIMTRLRKSFEQKEEFLRRPSHPIGWFLPEETSGSPVRSNGSAAAIPREFYARPQKLQKQIWPPNDSKQDQQSSASRASYEKSFAAKYALDKSFSSSSSSSSTSSSNQNVQRLRTDMAGEPEYSDSRNDLLDETNASRSLDDPCMQQAIAERLCSPSVCDDHLDKSDTKEVTERHHQQLHRNAGKSSFVGTLSRIHENISNAAALLSSERQSQDARNGASSLPSSPGLDKKANDKFPTLPQGLQIVSKRAKQFESGRLLSDDDEPTGDRTSLYKSELSRLSNKRSVPNVAVRKREFESKAEAQEPRRMAIATRETKSLDTGDGLKGNRVIPVGSRHIHCEPPTDYKPIEETPPNSRITDKDVTRSSIRSNSADSWESRSTNSQAARNEWSQCQETLERKESANEGDSSSYIDTSNSAADNSIERGSKRHDGYVQSIEATGPVRNDGVHGNGVVYRRQKNTQIADEDRATRRVSYLKATWGERMHLDSDLELSDSEPIHASRSVHKRWRLPLFPNDIASLRRIFEDMTQSTSLNRNIDRGNTCVGREGATGIVKDVEQVEREGLLHVKFTVLDGKRSSDRSWKQVWGVLRGPILFFYKDRQNQCPSLANDGENVTQSVDVRCSLVDIAEDYTKRKHVLRLANPSAEVLLQTEDAASMALWLRALHEHAAAEKPSENSYNSTLKQQAVPQAPGPTSSPATCQTMSAGTMAVSNGAGQRLSPLPGHKGIKKLTSFRNRSPTGQSPINKTRKSSQTIESLVSPKTKTWKGRVAKQLRKMHGQTGSPSSPTTQLPPEGATFKVPLELCPPSSFSEYVPLIVEMCTSIVEARGLEVVGIYRVPGNTAAISHLTDSVNKGFENINFQDPRWSDVNVISSLLKSFFRQLPDSLLTAELYPMFIDADKVEDPQRRMTTIRKLLRDLPEHHFETLKYLMLHLKRIVDHSEVNKMEAKNLAIVFGPTLVRASGSRDNMVTMVTDMSHQCRIVESLLNNVDWFFSDDDLDDLSRLSVNLSLPADNSEIDATSSNNHNLLLNNIQKVEGVREMASAKDIVSSIISAANRKIQRRRKGQDETDNESHHEIDKLKVKHEAEGLPNRRSMALNERQCSVSEIVLMHENKHQSGRSADRSDRTPSIDAVTIGDIPTVGNGGIGSCAPENTADMVNSNHGILSDRSRKYANQQVIESIQPIHRSAVSSASESSRLSSETGLSCFDASSTLSSASNDTKQSNDEVAIRTYAGLSATTQERIRRFEQETKAMLQRDQNRQRREAEKREEERRRIEMEWQLAKREMENDDLLDNIVDTTVAPTYLSSANRLSAFNDRLADKSLIDIGSRTTSRLPPLSIAVQQQPTSVRRVSQLADESAAILPSEINMDTIIKKLKTDQESMPSTLPPVRYGSLDSLHDTHDVSGSSPEQQQRKPLSSDVSDDGSDLLTSLTTTFDRKWRSLVNSTNQTARGSAAENASLSDEDVTVTESLRSLRGARENERKRIPCQSMDQCLTESYRDPSLHKSSLEKPQITRQKDDAPEKDTDSSVTENSSVDRLDENVPDNDRSASARRKMESKQDQLRSSKEAIEPNLESNETQACCKVTPEREGQLLTENGKVAADDSKDFRNDVDSNYSNKLEKFESLTNSEVRSRLKRSESLNKKSENTSSKLKRSESLNKHSVERLSSPTNGKLKRSESLNKHSDRSDSPNSKLKRSESLTKTEKTECNISKRRQSVRKDSAATKLKRKNGMPERSIKRRHTVGGTKDFDKVHWLDNKLQAETERVVKNEYRPKKSQLRTSSPDLSTGRIGLTDASFLIEVSFRGPSNVVLNVTNTRPQSLPDTSLASKVFKVPLESHV